VADPGFTNGGQGRGAACTDGVGMGRGVSFPLGRGLERGSASRQKKKSISDLKMATLGAFLALFITV